MNELAELLKLADDLALSCISTAEGLRNELSKRVEVLALKRALMSGSVTFDDVRAFVERLMERFVRGSKSQIDIVLAAIVNAIDFLPAKRVDDFLDSLAGVRIAEMPMAPRVARLAVRERWNRFTEVTIRDVSFMTPLPFGGDGPQEEHPVQIDSDINYQIFELTAS
jgi:hypothetical protein